MKRMIAFLLIVIAAAFLAGRQAGIKSVTTSQFIKVENGRYVAVYNGRHYVYD